MRNKSLPRIPTTPSLELRWDSLKECVGHLVRLLDSFHRESPMQILGHVRERACNDKLVQTEGAEQDPIGTCSLTTCKTKGEDNRVDVSKHKQQQLEQPQQQREEEGASEEEASDQKRPKQHNNNSLGTGQINSLGIGEQQKGYMYQIMVDTGAELSVAPRSFADHVQLSSCKSDLELRGADGNKIGIFGTRTVELVTLGFSFPACYVIADAERPLLSLRSLLATKPELTT